MLDSPIHAFDVDRGIPPAVVLYSDNGKPSPLSEYSDQHCRL